MFGFCLCVPGNQAHGVQKVAGSWQVSPLDPESAEKITLVEIKGRASGPSTAGHSRMRTNEPHMSKPEGRIETVFRRDEGCGQHLT